MDYEHEPLTLEMAERMLNWAYNEVTFKNALVCTLDWLNWYRCTHIHKDTRIGVDAEGVRIENYTQVKNSDKYVLTDDTAVVSGKAYFTYSSTTHKYTQVIPIGTENPEEEHWYEYVNPSDLEHNWYEKISVAYEYSPVDKNKLSYYDNPKTNKWYEKLNDEYFPSIDEHAVGSGPEAYIEVTPSANISPRDQGWYVYDSELENYIPTNDSYPVYGVVYYMCLYKQYYIQITENVKEYVKTTDTVVNPDKKYYTEKHVDHYVPDDPEAWDYSDHYERHVDITIPGTDDEITLNDRRPVMSIGG